MPNLNAEVKPQEAQSFEPLRVKKDQVYRHIKSQNLYLVIEVALREEDKEFLAVYQSLHTQQVWVRPLKEFKEKFTLADVESVHIFDGDAAEDVVNPTECRMEVNTTSFGTWISVYKQYEQHSEWVYDIGVDYFQNKLSVVIDKDNSDPDVRVLVPDLATYKPSTTHE